MWMFSEAIGRITTESDDTWGTAWIIAPGYAITALHCLVRIVEHGDFAQARIHFPEGLCQASVVWTDRTLDAAILCLTPRSESFEAIRSIAPIPIGALPSRSEWHPPAWSGYGYPLAHPEGLALTGTVDLPEVTDSRFEGATVAKAIQLFCRQGGSDETALSGVSGSPVIVAGHAVGLIYWAPVSLGERVIMATSLLSVAQAFSRSGESKAHSSLRTTLLDLQQVQLDKFDSTLGAYLSKVEKLPLVRTGLDDRSDRLRSLGDDGFVWAPIRPLPVTRLDILECEKSPPELVESTSINQAFPTALGAGRKHLLLFGQAGTGKSTLMRQFARLAWKQPNKLGLSERHIPFLVRLQSLACCGERHLEPLLDKSSDVSFTVPPPDGFLEEWHIRTGAPWLLIFDGLDEVPDSLRRKTIDRLFCFLEEDGPWKCVISSRFFPASQINDPIVTLFGYCKVFELLSLQPRDVEFLAKSLLGDRSPVFCIQFSKLKLGDRGFTPLLLTLSAKLFAEVGSLPRRRTELYANFIHRTLLNPQQTEALSAEVDVRLVKYNLLLPLLEALALDQTEETTSFDLKDCSGRIGVELEKRLGVPTREAPLLATQCIFSLSHRSGILRVQDQEVQWAHQTFREFLAASALTSAGNEERQRECVSRWESPKWKQVILFLLALLSKLQPELVGQLVNSALQPSRPTCFAELFFGLAVAEGATIPDVLLSEIISRLEAAARKGGKLSYCQSFYAELSESGGSPTDVLGWLLPNSNAENSLTQIVCDSEVQEWQKVNALRSLCSSDRHELALGLCRHVRGRKLQNRLLAAVSLFANEAPSHAGGLHAEAR